MTVSANDLCFFDLGQYPLLRGVPTEHNWYVGDFCLGGKMIKIHTIGRIAFSTILTCPIFQLGQVFSPNSLPPPPILVSDLLIVLFSLTVIALEVRAHTAFAIGLNFLSAAWFDWRAAD